MSLRAEDLGVDLDKATNSLSSQPTEREQVPLSEVPTVTTYVGASEVLRSPKFTSAIHNRKSYPIFGGAILQLHGAEHMTRRRAELPLFARPALEHYEQDLLLPTFRASLKAMAEEASGSDWAVVDLITLVQLALLRVTAALVGIDGIATDADAANLRQIGGFIGTAVSVEFSNRDANEVIEEAMNAKAEFIDRYFHSAFERRRVILAKASREGEQVEIPRDLLTILMQTYPDWQEDNFVRECLFFLTASSNTTTNAMPHAFGELSRWLTSHQDDSELVFDTEFMQSAVAEAIRLHPPIPSIIRRAVQDVQLSSGPLIRTGELVVIDTNVANRDTSSYGEDADEFNPHRSVGGKVQPFGTSFAGGTHMCPGRPVAIGGVGGGTTKEEETSGSLVLMLQELFAVGAEIGTETPVVRPDFQDTRYSSYPIRIPLPLNVTAE